METLEDQADSRQIILDKYKPDTPLAFVLDVSASIAEIEVGNLVARNAFRLAFVAPYMLRRHISSLLPRLQPTLVLRVLPQS